MCSRPWRSRIRIGDHFNFDSRLFSVLRVRGRRLLRYGHDIQPRSRREAVRANFRAGIEKHAVDPEDALHVGDSERDDVKGAIAVGLTGVLLARGLPPEGSNGATIATLNELPPPLSRLQ